MLLRGWHSFEVASANFCLILAVASSLLVIAVVPPDSVVSTPAAILSCFIGVFATRMKIAIWKSRASIEHWRLLRTIIDWDTVDRLLADDPDAQRTVKEHEHGDKS